MPGGSLTSKPTRLNTYGCSAASAFFVSGFAESAAMTAKSTMNTSNPNSSNDDQDRFTDDGNPTRTPQIHVAQRIAKAASDFEHARTGILPNSVSVVLSDQTLVITLHGALSEAEQVLARTAEGAARVQEFHRQLFSNASHSLRQEIKRITGVDVRQATAEVEPSTGAIVGVFTTGTTVQVYLLANAVPSDSWNGIVPADKRSV